MADQITFLRLPQVMQRTGLGRAIIYKMMLADLFPRPIPIIGRHVAWIEAHIDRYCELKAERASDQDIKDFVISLKPTPVKKSRRPTERIRLRA